MGFRTVFSNTLFLTDSITFCAHFAKRCPAARDKPAHAICVRKRNTDKITIRAESPAVRPSTIAFSQSGVVALNPDPNRDSKLEVNNGILNGDTKEL